MLRLFNSFPCRLMSTFSTNGRTYKLPSSNQASVAICLDGSEQDYFDVASNSKKTPHFDELVKTKGIVKSAMPSFTNPNNLSIITGVPPSQTGICGNYFFNRESGEEVMMTSSELLRCGTILQDLEKNGSRIVVVTAKNKLLQLLTHGLTNCVGFSVERFDDPIATETIQQAKLGVSSVQELMGGRKAPHIYDPDCSIYCIEAGLRLIERMQEQSADPIMAYLSTTDYVQHKYAPNEPQALDFYQKLDGVFGDLDRIGCNVALTADHGMKPKHDDNGAPYVAFLGSILGPDARVILPITDPYVKHHGSLGGYATIYVEDVNGAKRTLEEARDDRLNFDVYTAKEASEMFELPIDRIGDLVVVGDHRTVLGRTPEYHDLSEVPWLRTHGAVSETDVPLISNFELSEERLRNRLGSGAMRNFDIFDVLLNGSK